MRASDVDVEILCAREELADYCVLVLEECPACSSRQCSSLEVAIVTRMPQIFKKTARSSAPTKQHTAKSRPRQLQKVLCLRRGRQKVRAEAAGATARDMLDGGNRPGHCSCISPMVPAICAKDMYASIIKKRSHKKRLSSSHSSQTKPYVPIAIPMLRGLAPVPSHDTHGGTSNHSKASRDRTAGGGPSIERLAPCASGHCTNTFRHLHARTHARTHACTHARTHAQKHKHTQTQTCAWEPACIGSTPRYKVHEWVLDGSENETSSHELKKGNVPLLH